MAFFPLPVGGNGSSWRGWWDGRGFRGSDPGVGSRGACGRSPWLECWLTIMAVRAAWWLAVGGGGVAVCPYHVSGMGRASWGENHGHRPLLDGTVAVALFPPRHSG